MLGKNVFHIENGDTWKMEGKRSFEQWIGIYLKKNTSLVGVSLFGGLLTLGLENHRGIAPFFLETANFA